VVGAPHTELEGQPVAGAIAAAKAMQTATSPVSRAAATMPVAESRKFGATNLQASVDHVWFEDRWIVASLYDD
jgi:hypothetical protein